MQELRKLADTAEDEGKMGSDIISESNEMMGLIENSSKQIERITVIITDIAEQTNLLSLNAAIEADKAGDYGKGFAVVAEEVGELAERSNEAAKQISELIKRNDDNVFQGKEVINETGEFLEQIIKQVRMMANEVNQLVSSITEQDIGTREIAKGAEEISQKSDKSLELITKLATLIKESNTTISNLSEIADRLESQVSSFRD
jgi:methyl-accepting chemotaxis protein